MSLENQVTLDTPKNVSVAYRAGRLCAGRKLHSVLYSTACTGDSGRNAYLSGRRHGLGLANEETQSYEYQNAVREECQSWISLAIDWMRHL
mgnify:CR=1 FL=1